jgi:hypothetical protein
VDLTFDWRRYQYNQLMLVIVPSRGRPHNVDKLIKSFVLTRTNATLLVVVDNDDPKLDEYKSLDYPKWARLVTQAPRRIGPTLNDFSKDFVDDVDVIGFMGDDHRPRTNGWDMIIDNVVRYTNRTGIVYGNDLLQGQHLPTAVFITSDIIKTLGYMCPPGMQHMYLDNVWKLWGEKIGRLVYLNDMVIEHMHPVAKKAVWDEGYAVVNSGEMYANDERVMNEYIAERLDEDVKKMKELL